MTRSDCSIALTGSGGAGAITAGELLLRLAGRQGGFGLMRRSFGPQIRGGEAAALLRFSTSPVGCMNDAFDLFLALDWSNADRFGDEIPLTDCSLVLHDPAAGDVPETILASGAQVSPIPLKHLAGTVEGGRPNMIALGALAALLGLDRDLGRTLVEAHFAAKGTAIVGASSSAFRTGYAAVEESEALEPSAWRIAWATAADENPADSQGHWSLTGNEGCGLGALRGGIRFAAAYPITPASDMLEWLAPRLEQLGGSLLQAEDELASINMVTGASFGGVPAMTATSGPGLSLMLEGMGLAVASETPALVVNVMRGGPSTGIPTKSEQADLDQALHGLHGDAPHLVLGALDHADCILTTEWATRLAEQLQTVAVVLSDQNLAQSRVLTIPPDYTLPELEGRIEATAAGHYERYALTESGVSPMARPGTPGCMYTADGLEHEAGGKPSTAAAVHAAQLDKRERKITAHDYGDLWAEIRDVGPEHEDPPALALLTWGSTTGAVREAATRLADNGRAVRVIALRLLAPAQPDALASALEGIDQVLAVEQSHSRQFLRYLRAHYDIAPDLRALARPGPLLFTPGEIVDHVEQEFTA
jgi:2-oxoglutarate ferredoxin oxidoreductase subunit alpha